MLQYKFLVLAFLSSLSLSCTNALANSGSFVAAQFAEKEKDYKNASYFYIDMVSSGSTDGEIVKRSIIYSTLAGDYEVATAISRKIDDFQITYPAASLILLADAIHKKKRSHVLRALERHKKNLPNIFEKVAEFWGIIIKNEKDLAFSFINSMPIDSEAQLQVVNYNQLLAFVYFNEYQQAKTLYENFDFSDFLFDSESALALIEYFQKNQDKEIVESMLRKARAASDNPYYILALTNSLSKGDRMPPLKVTPYKQLAELFFRWSQSTQNQERSAINKTFYLALANYADSASSFLKFKLAIGLFDSGNFELSREILDSLTRDDLFFMDGLVENTYAIEKMENDKAALAYIEKFISSGVKNASLLKAYGSLLRSQQLFKESIYSYTQAIEAAKKELYTEAIWPILFLRGISFERSKDWESAEADFLNALEIMPDQPQILNYMGYSLLERKEKLDQAMRMISLAAEKSPNSYHIIDSLGWAYYRNGEFTKALLYLERAMELESTDPIVNDHLGDVLWMLGRKREAKFQWKKSLSFNPEPIDQKNTEDKLTSGLDVR